MEDREKITETNKKRNDLLLLLGLAAAAGVFLLFSHMKTPGAGRILVVTVDGKEIIREPVTEEKVLTIDCGNGDYNRIRVTVGEDGTAGIRCEESNCSEQICVNKGLVTLESDAIVCLPHRMTARLISGEAG